MFESFDDSQRWLLLTALVDRVRANWGKGFHNNDQGHPAYRGGCMEEIDFKTWGDSPEHNTLYKMMKELSESLKDYPDILPEDLIFSWKDFCKMATEAYKSTDN